jgi:integral membrane protein
MDSGAGQDVRAADRGAPAKLAAMKKSVLTRYRVMAYVTAVLLILLTVGVIGKRLLDLDGFDGFVTVVGIAHGWLYVVYLIFAFDVGNKAKMPVGRLLWVLLAGTIPTAAFFVERRVTREVEPLIAQEPAPKPAAA